MKGLFSNSFQMLLLLSIPLFLSIQVVLSEPSNGVTTNCTRIINGVRGACNLRFTSFTMVGAHSAGAGAYGHLNYVPGLQAPDCRTRNQDRSLTALLQSGVRYFELKVRFLYPRVVKESLIDQSWVLYPAEKLRRVKQEQSRISKRELLPMSTEEMAGEEGVMERKERDNLSFLDRRSAKLSKRDSEKKEVLPSVADKTLYLYHDGAYSKPLSAALKEIDGWLGSNKNEIVVVRVSNTDDKHDIYNQTSKELSVLFHTDANKQRNPTLGSAVDSNQRIFLFIEQKHYLPHLHDIRLHPIMKLGTSINPKTHGTCVETTTLYARGKDTDFSFNKQIVQIDWFHNLNGVCNKDLAKLCNSREIDRLERVNSVILRDYHHPLNLILMDYVEKDDGEKLKHVVQKINEKNVRLYA